MASKNTSENPILQKLKLAFVGLMTIVGVIGFEMAAPGIMRTLVDRPNFSGNALGEMEPIVRCLIPLFGGGAGTIFGALVVGAAEGK